MENESTNNKRIAKNTFYLYFRMLFQLIVGLLTARYVLQALGVVDYGIYGVVGGVVAMFSFINGSMANATMRFLTYELGKGDDQIRLRQVFSTAIIIHFGISIILIILSETVGLWYVFNHLVYPSERLTAVLWLYHFSILTTVVAILSVPYNAAIVSHEKMNAFAYISIYETICQVIVIFIIVYTNTDKLILYGFLLMIIQISIRIIYGIYCKQHFKEVSGKFYFDKHLFRKMLSFALWVVNGSVAFMAYTQGLNLLLNVFFGPTVNAARTIAITVQAKIMGFCTNFQMAVNPQITKSYAVGNFNYMHKLICNSSKYSLLLIFFLSYPIILECPYILKLWLGIVPEQTIVFVRLTLIIGIISALQNPMNTSAHATGNIKKYQLFEGTTLLLIVPISYCFLKFNYPPSTVFIVQLVIFVLVQCIRVIIVCPMIKMSKTLYFNEVVFKSIKVIIPATILPFTLENICTLNNETIKFIIVCLSSLICSSISIFYIGMDNNIRTKVILGIKNKLQIHHNK